MGYYQAGSVLDEAITTAKAQIKKVNDYATDYNAYLRVALAEIGSVEIGDIPDMPTFDAPPVPTLAIDTGGIPDTPAVVLNMPERPSRLDIGDLLTDLNVGELDDLPDMPAPPTQDIPLPPTMNMPVAPDTPDLGQPIEFPDAPVIVLPEIDALIELNLPEFEPVVIPDFEAEAPTADDILMPENAMDYSPQDYSRVVLDDVLTQIRSQLTGGTGIPPVVEEALFQRAKERITKEGEANAKDAINQWAARGFSLPQGALSKTIESIRSDSADKVAEANREVFVQAAQWEIEAVKNAVQQGMALEQLTYTIHSDEVKIGFEVAKINYDNQMALFNARVSLFNAKNQAFQTMTQLYKTKVEAAMSKLQAYKLAIDGQLALGQVNSQKIDIYKAKLQTVMSNVELYKALMQAASIRSEAVKQKIDIYRAQIEAFGQTIGAEKTKFDAYDSQIKAQTSKVGMYEAQARAFASTVQALSSKADLKGKQAQIRIEAARVRTAEYAANIDAYKSDTQAAITEVEFANKTFQAKLDAWKAKTTASSTEAEMMAKQFDMITRTNIAFAEMQIANYKANAEKITKRAEVQLEASKAVGQYSAQLAAGAMSAMHTSTGLSASGSATASDHFNYNMGGS